MKKAVLITALLLGVATVGFSQKVVDKKIETEGKKTELKLDFADNIRIEAWDKNYVEFHSTANIDDNQYNDFYEISVSETSGKAEIIEKIDFDGIKEKVGKKELCNFEMDIEYSVKVPKNLNFSVKTIAGEIELIACEGKMDVNSISGFIDYSIPKNLDAQLNLSTVTGDVYSNVRFESGDADEISWVGTNRKLTLNGGDKDIKLKTVSGDIYLRKY
ncbi:hypothetical protein SLH46_03370 [Draconibacterium sp. IB214405]|uniref:DUF4097 family beta strand repeat-containing protein n=1 Tax=Draconibacterium sp. IB214405 TaxID=3097352 RepID=UPI002A0EDDA1|nr:DUF4097 family beta strand repeat-containing protein [Draconibacterium sp. IB214405]MDX8338209.1 hypothetical protein [Draconibacterium sp. IB214405]